MFKMNYEEEIKRHTETIGYLKQRACKSHGEEAKTLWRMIGEHTKIVDILQTLKYHTVYTEKLKDR